ncbi:hypothetical protein HPB48_000540 [Haemaphysalis longicornis]|uniref:Reverse transcriptase domain-containing protein n=1 Tax=Haemaphysalis longicornis TaxID=44386 RepID=A0A9J6F936_HAELO|nr:hypothetical protein HPB48_000540 [Haemaphysalis longicornis]
MGTQTTLQGAVLSPLLNNIGMMELLHELARVECIKPALHGDDITILTTDGSLGEMEGWLQRAGSITEI